MPFGKIKKRGRVWRQLRKSPPSEGSCEGKFGNDPCGFWDITHPMVKDYINEMAVEFYQFHNMDLQRSMSCKCVGDVTQYTTFPNQVIPPPKMPVSIERSIYKYVSSDSKTPKQLIAAAYKKANIPLNYGRADQTFGTFFFAVERPTSHDHERKRVKQKLKEFADRKMYPRTVLIHGPVGVGKSHLAIAVLRHCLDKGLTARYENSRELVLDKLLPGYKGDTDQRGMPYETRGDIINICKTVDILCLDDIGTEKSSEHTVGSLYDIIDTRMREGKLLIVTTNIPAHKSKEQFGDRIHSRLSASDVLTLSLDIEDYRQKRLEIK